MQNMKNFRQSFHNSLGTKAQITPNADIKFTKERQTEAYTSVCFNPHFLSFCPVRKISIPSNSTNLSGKSLRQIRGRQWTLLNTKNPPQTFYELGDQRSEPLLWVKQPLVCLKYSSARTSPPGKNLMLLHLQALSTLIGRDITRLSCIRAFKPLQKEKECVTEEETKMRQKVSFYNWNSNLYKSV